MTADSASSADAVEREILVTASRAPVAADSIGVSATVIGEARIEALGEVQAVDLLRLIPGVSVAVSGSRGTQTQLRIRGGEANHSLVFIDGIGFNDPAAGNESRFESFSADGIGRIEVIRGPQSALWGSEALGGVIALEGPDPLRGDRLDATIEYGSRDSARAALAGTLGDARHGVTLTASHARSDGIDIVGGGAGDRDGFENTTLALRAVTRPAPDGELGIAARHIAAESEFDGFDPLSFLRADTLDRSESDTSAVRGWAALGLGPAAPWSITAEAQYLTSGNDNFLGDAPLNRTSAERFVVGGQIERRIAVAGSRHALIAATEREDENFAARDQQYFGLTDQDRSRGRTAFIGEWRAEWGRSIVTDLAVRHDDFNAFADATTIRAAATAEVVEGLHVRGSWGEGIAQPTFFDLYGFFPGSFVGNPDLAPERARGYEVGVEWRGERVVLSATGFRSALRDEIVPVFDSGTFLSSTANASGKSRRQGIELAAALAPLPGLRIDVNYTLLDADDQQVVEGLRIREVRRPRHGASLALDWETGPLLIGASFAYVGARKDADFDVFPAPSVTLGDYVLANARIACRIGDVELFARVENLLDAHYQDAFGYATPGIGGHAGVRLRLGD
ncbi:MAG: TonB-dependent receptor [Sphingomonadaceae bacterium]|nr:TonB-dependent receptor [Sphingomonadaceae bacterium]